MRAWRDDAAWRALPASADGAPNVLYIILDTVRARNLSLYGYARPTSPNMARLAAEGVTFDYAFATTSWTLPSHGSLMTGVDAKEPPPPPGSSRSATPTPCSPSAWRLAAIAPGVRRESASTRPGSQELGARLPYVRGRSRLAQAGPPQHVAAQTELASELSAARRWSGRMAALRPSQPAGAPGVLAAIASRQNAWWTSSSRKGSRAIDR
ncbi:MAG: sulfatase-like hydrolase/transferase [Gemmatimonadetes bacterium]|nr:sulfatase-like hydrolase/transferase [Gemmatimonadota bacterium]